MGKYSKFKKHGDEPTMLGALQRIGNSDGLHAIADVELAVRHVRTPAGQADYHEPIGSVIVKHPKLNADHMASAGLYADKFHSSQQLAKAQVAAEQAWGKVARRPLYDAPDQLFKMSDGTPERSWGMYQMDGAYEAINQQLRDGTHADNQYGDSKLMASGMTKAFDKMGFTTTAPMVTYRSVVDKPWVDDIKPGGVWADKGVISTAPDTDEIAGFMDTDPDESGPAARRKSTLMEIHVPKGTRVLGSAQGGIELMLKPGTKFKVLSTGKKTIGGVTAGDGSTITKYPLDTIVLEVLPNA